MRVDSPRGAGWEFGEQGVGPVGEVALSGESPLALPSPQRREGGVGKERSEGMECRLKDIAVHYEAHGRGHPALLLHGGGPDHRSLTGCMEPVFRRHPGWQRLYPDLPGLGATPGAAWITSSDQMLEVVLEFVHATIPGKSYALVGESYGAYLARGIIRREPERVDGLMMVCPTVTPGRAGRTLPPHVTLASDDAFMAGLAPEDRERFGHFAVVQNRRTWERTRDEVLVGFPLADRAFLARLEAQGYAFSFEVDAGAAPFGKPTLILAGRQDSMVGYRDAWGILENYPRATYAVLDRAGHNLHIEQERLFNALAGEWLDRVAEGIGSRA